MMTNDTDLSLIQRLRAAGRYDSRANLLTDPMPQESTSVGIPAAAKMLPSLPPPVLNVFGTSPISRAARDTTRTGSESSSKEKPTYSRVHAISRRPSPRSAALQRDLSPLQGSRELALLGRLALYPQVLREAADELVPHQIAFYLKDLAADFHAFYNAERVLVDDSAQRDARLALLLATRQVLRNALRLLGVSAPERM